MVLLILMGGVIFKSILIYVIWKANRKVKENKKKIAKQNWENANCGNRAESQYFVCVLYVVTCICCIKLCVISFIERYLASDINKFIFIVF